MSFIVNKAKLQKTGYGFICFLALNLHHRKLTHIHVAVTGTYRIL